MERLRNRFYRCGWGGGHHGESKVLVLEDGRGHHHGEAKVLVLEEGEGVVGGGEDGEDHHQTL
jgi:hypothetical protein